MTMYVFSRLVDDGEPRMMAQTVTVFTPDEATARNVLDQDLQEKRLATADDEPALRDLPDWRVHSVELDEPKIVTFAVS